jgi:hypothetical protein
MRHKESRMRNEFIDDRNRRSQLRLNSVPMAGVTAAPRAYCLRLGGLKPSPSGDGFQRVRAG